MKFSVKPFCPKRATLGLALVAASMQTNAIAGGGSIGDLPGYGEETYFSPDAAYDEQAYQSDTGDGYFDPAPSDQISDSAPNQISDGNFAGEPAEYVDEFDNEPAGDAVVIGSGYHSMSDEAYPETTVQSVGFVDDIRAAAGGWTGGFGRSGASTGSCDMMPMTGTCDAYGCDSMSCKESLCEGNTWATMEALLWFVEDRNTVPLAITFDDSDIEDPEPRLSSVSEFSSGLAPGFRVDAGSWLTENIGVGGRFSMIFDGSTDVNFAANTAQDQSAVGTGIPFIDPNVGTSLFLVNAIEAAGPISAGSIDIEEEIEFWMAEAYGRIRFAAARRHSLDLVGGYTRMELENTLGLDVNRIALDSSIQALGTRTILSDRFETENTFNGGQVGFEAVMTRGRWMARSLTKVHLGNMNQRVSRRGSGTVTTPGFAAADTGGGFFGRSEGESIERDLFAFIPEANFKLGYALTPHAYLTAGYTFLYLDNVALASTAINPIVSPPLAGFENGPPLGFGSDNVLAIADDSLFIHGVDVGLVLDF